MNETRPIFNPASLEQVRRLRRSMMSGFTAESLASALEDFERGHIRPAAQLWETIAERDDVIKSVKPKREKALARREFQIVINAPKGREAEAKAQQSFLNGFWNNVTAVNAFDRNDSGGFSKLVRQMLTSVSFKYAAHHILWRVEGDKLRASFEFVPLIFFENTTGTLRFCPKGSELKGEELAEGEWMVTCGDGLMIAASIGVLAKRNSLADWMIFSERVNVPGTLGRTPHAQGSPAGDAMAEAVEAFGSEWKAVIYEDNGQSKIETIDFGRNTSLPFPALIERVDRRLAALWRGADLSSISSSSGQGTGASLQGDEADLLEKDDALAVEEKLDEVSRRVLRWRFGDNVEPLAYLKIVVPTPEDQKLLITAVEMLVKHGAPVSVSDVLERFGFAPPDETAELLRAPLDYQSSYSEAFKDGASDGSGFDLMNERQAVTATNARADDTDFMREAARLLATAAAEDRKPIATALRNVLALDDKDLFGALTAFNAALPDHVAQDAEQTAAWHSIIASAFLRGLTLGTPTV